MYFDKRSHKIAAKLIQLLKYNTVNDNDIDIDNDCDSVKDMAIDNDNDSNNDNVSFQENSKWVISGPNEGSRQIY